MIQQQLLTLYSQQFQNTFQKVKKVQLIGFGNFEVRERAARKGRNPQTGKEIKIAASKVPAFKLVKLLKKQLNNCILKSHPRFLGWIFLLDSSIG